MLRLQKICRNGLFLLSVLAFMIFDMGLAAEQKVTNKDNIPPKEVTGTDKPDAEKEQLDKGYIYDPTGKTDPFQSFIAIREEKDEKAKKPKTYLETLELSQLDLAAIVISSKDKWAMVRDSKEVGHVIREGTPIGTNGGVVYKIRPGEVVIREEFRDFRGKTQYREIVKKSESLQE